MVVSRATVYSPTQSLNRCAREEGIGPIQSQTATPSPHQVTWIVSVSTRGAGTSAVTTTSGRGVSAPAPSSPSVLLPRLAPACGTITHGNFVKLSIHSASQVKPRVPIEQGNPSRAVPAPTLTLAQNERTRVGLCLTGKSKSAIAGFHMFPLLYYVHFISQVRGVFEQRRIYPR